MSLSRYPEYKPSGIEWLPEVPSHWIVKRVRHAANLNPSKRETEHLPRELQVDFLPMEAVGTDGRISRAQKRPIETVIDGFTYFREGDVALAKITPCFENGKCAVMRDLAEGVGFGTTELIVLRPRPDQAVSEYLFYLLSSEPFRVLGESEMYGAGGQKRVPDKFVRNFRIAFPPVPEQKQIADFLDHETTKIDALIEEQQRLIELLKEKRQAVISHAVTKGIDPDARMKDSGVEWLGKIPHHWDCKRAKFLLQEKDERSESGKEELLTVSHLTGITPRSEKQVYMIQAESLENYKKVASGDIVINTMWAWMGAMGCSKFDGIVSPSYNVYRFQDGSAVNSGYFDRVVRTDEFRQYVASISQGVWQSRLRLYPEAFLNERLPVPEVEEQDAIVNYLERTEDLMGSLVDEAQRQIHLLQERRKALISAAVTGKIDVRNWQPKTDTADELPMAAEALATYEARES